MVAYTRPAALAAKAAAEPGGVPAEPDPALFADEAEHALAAALAEVRGPLATALAGGDVEAALCAAAALRAPVDRYFDDVLVMDNDPAVRANRLAQLAQITAPARQPRRLQPPARPAGLTSGPSESTNAPSESTNDRFTLTKLPFTGNERS